MIQTVTKKLFSRGNVLRQGAILLCTALLLLAIWYGGRYTTPSEVPSLYNADISMPASAASVLDDMEIVTVNCHMDGMNVIMDDDDPQFVLKMLDRVGYPMRSVEVILEHGYNYNLDASLYFGYEGGPLTGAQCVQTRLPAGETHLYFPLPTEADRPVWILRLDIDDDFVLQDIRSSAEDIINPYVPAEHTSRRTWATLGISLLCFLELLCFFRPELLRICRAVWKNRFRVLAELVIIIFSAAAGVLGAKGWCRLFFAGSNGFNDFIALAGGFGGILAVSQLRMIWRAFRDGHLRALWNDRKGLLLFCGILAVFLFLIGLEWSDAAVSAQEKMADPAFSVPYLYAVIETILLALLFAGYALGRKEGEVPYGRAFTYCLLLLTAAYTFVFLPFVSPDEFSHYLSAYRLSDLLLGKVSRMDDFRLLMRAEDYAFYLMRKKEISYSYYADMASHMRLFAQQSGMIVIDAPMTGNAVLSYWIPAFGITLGRLLRLGAWPVFYLGRLCNALFFVGTMSRAMKKLASGRTALFAVAGLPMMLHLAGSYSYDLFTFCFVALYVTQVLYLCDARNSITGRQIALCVLYGVLMVPSKVVYSPLLLLALLIPAERLSGDARKKYVRRLSAVTAAAAIAAVLLAAVYSIWVNARISDPSELLSTAYVLRWSREEGFTLAWILANPWQVLLMIIRTFIVRGDIFLHEMLGSQLGWLNISIPHMYAMASLVLLVLSVHIREDERWPDRQTEGFRKGWILLLCVASGFAVMLAMLLYWTPNSYKTIAGVQGRYFLPLLVPGIFLFGSRLIRVDTAMRRRILAGTVLLDIWVLVYMYSAYLFA